MAKRHRPCRLRPTAGAFAHQSRGLQRNPLTVRRMLSVRGHRLLRDAGWLGLATQRFRRRDRHIRRPVRGTSCQPLGRWRTFRVWWPDSGAVYHRRPGITLTVTAMTLDRRNPDAKLGGVEG